jgi:hypothetical protein
MEYGSKTKGLGRGMAVVVWRDVHTVLNSIWNYIRDHPNIEFNLVWQKA